MKEFCAKKVKNEEEYRDILRVFHFLQPKLVIFEPECIFEMGSKHYGGNIFKNWLMRLMFLLMNF